MFSVIQDPTGQGLSFERPSLCHSNRFALLILFIVVIGDVLIAFASEYWGLTSMPLRSLLIYSLEMALPAVLYFLLHRSLSPVRVLRLRPLTIQSILLILLISFCVQPALMCLSSLTSLAFHNYVNASVASYRARPLLSVLLFTCLLPALCEETICRGIYLNGLRRQNIFLGALLSGLFFGLLHLNLQQGLYAAVFGFLCALLVYATNSLFASILAHFVINGTQIVLLFIDLPLSATNGADAAKAVKAVNTLKAVEAASPFTAMDWLTRLPLYIVIPASLLLALAAFWLLVRLFHINHRDALLHRVSEDLLEAHQNQNI